jgi:hypothetical protein
MGEIPHGKPRHGKAHVFPFYFYAVNHHEILSWLASNGCKLEKQADPFHRGVPATSRVVSQTERMTPADSTNVQITRSVSWLADFTFTPVISRTNPLAAVTGARAVQRTMRIDSSHVAITRRAHDCGISKI